MRMRSKGSLWCQGSRAAVMAGLRMTGNSTNPAASSAPTQSSGRSNFPQARLISSSQTDAALANTRLAGDLISAATLPAILPAQEATKE